MEYKQHRLGTGIILWVMAFVLWPCTMRAQLLYRVSGNGVHAPSYILATNRLADLTFIDSIPDVFEAFGRCDRVVTEFAIEDYEALAALRKAAVLPDTSALAHYYKPDEFERISTTMTFTLGMPMSQLFRMRPAYLTELYRTDLLRRELGYDDQRSMETFFEEVARQKEMPIVGLDDINETIYMLFAHEPFEQQCRELLSIVDAPFVEVEQERAILQLFRKGLLTDISYQVSGPNNHSTIAYSDYRVFVRRNAEWVRRLKPELRTGGCFITLNAIYLGGDEGLLAQLRAEGYKISPVSRHRLK